MITFLHSWIEGCQLTSLPADLFTHTPLLTQM